MGLPSLCTPGSHSFPSLLFLTSPLPIPLWPLLDSHWTDPRRKRGKNNFSSILKNSYFFKLNLLGWQWLTEPYRFQVYKPTKHHLHTASCAHHPKQSFFPSPFPSPLPPFPFPHPLSLWLSPHCCLCLCALYICLWVNPFTSFHPVLQTLSPLTTAGSLFRVYEPLSSVYFAHEIP